GKNPFPSPRCRSSSTASAWPSAPTRRRSASTAGNCSPSWAVHQRRSRGCSTDVLWPSPPPEESGNESKIGSRPHPCSVCPERRRAGAAAVWRIDQRRHGEEDRRRRGRRVEEERLADGGL